MAVEDKYVNSNVAEGKLAKAIHGNGGKVFAMMESFEIAAADDDGSVYRVFKNLSPDLIPLEITIMCDAITGGSDFDLGLYEKGVGGAVVDKDCFMDGQTLVTASRTLDGLQTVDIANLEQMLYEHGGHTVSTKKEGYDLALTGNTVGTAAGTVTIIALFAQG